MFGKRVGYKNDLFDFAFPFPRALIQGPSERKREERCFAAGCFGMGDFFGMKKTLGPGCHLLHGPGILLTRLRGMRFARPIPNGIGEPTPSSTYRGASNRSFIPTYSCCLPNRFRGRLHDGTRASVCISLFQGRNESRPSDGNKTRSFVSLFKKFDQLCVKNEITLK